MVPPIFVESAYRLICLAQCFYCGCRLPPCFTPSPRLFSAEPPIYIYTIYMYIPLIETETGIINEPINIDHTSYHSSRCYVSKGAALHVPITSL